MMKTSSIRKRRHKDIWQWICLLLLLASFAWYESVEKGDKPGGNSERVKYSVEKTMLFFKDAFLY